MKDFIYSGGLVARMQLLDSSGTVLTDTSGTVGDGLNLDRYTLNTGTYYVKFTQITGSDPYTFRITSDYAGDVTGTARNLGDITNNSRQLYDMVGLFGFPTYDDATDLYKFTLSRTSPIDIKLHIAQGLTPPTFDASLQLARDTNGDGFIQAGEIFSQSANTGDDAISTTLAAGTYYAVVVRNGAYTSYQLDLDSDFDANAGDPAAYKNMSKAVGLGTLVGEATQYGGFGISAGDFADYYKFTVSATGTVSIGASNLGPFTSRTTYTPSIAIIRDANNNLKNDTGESIVTGTGRVTATLAPGTYYLGLFGNGQQLSYYTRLVSDYAGNTLGTARPMGAVNVYSPTTQSFRDYIEQNFGSGSDVNDFYRFDLPETFRVQLNTSGVAGEDLSLSLIKDVNNNGID